VGGEHCETVALGALIPSILLAVQPATSVSSLSHTSKQSTAPRPHSRTQSEASVVTSMWGGRGAWVLRKHSKKDNAAGCKTTKTEINRHISRRTEEGIGTLNPSPTKKQATLKQRLMAKACQIKKAASSFAFKPRRPSHSSHPFLLLLLLRIRSSSTHF
jgi:hypothetical protein